MEITTIPESKIIVNKKNLGVNKMTRKEWKEITKKMVESFPTDTLVNGNFEDKVVIKLLTRFYKAL